MAVLAVPPKFSIITVCLNRADFIADALESVLAQDFPDFEHLVIDGGSTDGTLAILAKYPHLKVVSEPDQGLYDALNKGIRMARGEIIGLLNSDDIYQPGIFATVARVFETSPQADVVGGQATQFQDTPQGRLILEFFPAVTPQNLAYRLMRGVPIINAWFFRREVFERTGAFDLNFPIAADRDFQIRCWLSGIKIEPVEKFFYNYRKHQTSATGSGDLAMQEKYLRDMLRLADKYIRADLKNPPAAKKFIHWRDALQMDLVVSNLRRKNFRVSLRLIAINLKQKPAWLLTLLVQFPLRLLVFLFHRLSAMLFPRRRFL